MGCTHSKKKSKSKRNEKNYKYGESGNARYEEDGVSLEKQLEMFEWQLKVLKEVVSASGSQERAELLREHCNAEVCSIMHSITDKVRTETAAELNVLHEERSKRESEEHERTIAELNRRQQQDIAHLTETFRAAENVLKAQVEALTSDLRAYNELKRRVEESTFKKDLVRNIQAHGSPGAFWESEQESLLFVIEMKSERVGKQMRRLQQMEALVEKNLSLEDQVIQVLQQNEDMRVRMENYQTLIQQLSKEQQELKGALERQMSVSHTLSQEKEQLMFKLRHRDSCPTIQLAAVLQERTPR